MTLQIARVLGKKSSEARDILGFIGSQFVADRNNIAVLVREVSADTVVAGKPPLPPAVAP